MLLCCVVVCVIVVRVRMYLCTRVHCVNVVYTCGVCVSMFLKIENKEKPSSSSSSTSS